MDVTTKLPSIKGTTYVVEVTTTGSMLLGTTSKTDDLYYSVEVYKPTPGQPINSAFQLVGSQFAQREATLEDIDEIVSDIIAGDSNNLAGKYRDDEVYARLEQAEREREETQSPPEEETEDKGQSPDTPDVATETEGQE